MKDKKWFGKITVILLCMMLVFNVTAFAKESEGAAQPASAVPTSDVTGHWAEAQISSWIDKGFIKGYEDGSFGPSNSITRAEFIALINRSFGFTETAKIAFSDVASDNWAYGEVEKAVKAGYITGYDDGTIGAGKPISRQEVAVIVNRLLALTQKTDVPSAFIDSALIAPWAKDAVGVTAAQGILKGYEDNSFGPGKSITRAEAVVTLDRAITVRASSSTVDYHTAGTYGPATGVETVNKNVVVHVAGVKLQNMVINGDLLLAEGIGNGDAFLDNVQVTGKVTVQGGGENSIHFNNSVLVDIIIDKKSGAGTVRIVSEGTTTVALVIINSPATLKESNSTGAGFGNVNVSSVLPAGSKVTFTGSFETVNVSSQSMQIDVPEGTIKKLNINSAAKGTSLNLSKEATINELVLDAIIKMLGKGTIVLATMNIAGSTFETPPTTTKTPTPSGPVIVTPPDTTLPALTGLAELNAASSVEAVKTIIEKTANQTIFGITMIDYKALDAAGKLAVALAVYNNGVNYATTAEVKIAFDTEVAIQKSNSERPIVVSAAFSSEGPIVITFNKPVIATLSNFPDSVYIDSGQYSLTRVSGSGTNTITIKMYYNVPKGSSTSSIAIQGVTDLEGHVMVSVPNQFISRYDNTPPTVIKLGDGTTAIGVQNGHPIELIFNEELPESAKHNIEAALAANADHPLVFDWPYSYSVTNGVYSQLTISAAIDTLFTNDVIVNVEDTNGNTALDLLLIDTIMDSQPTAVSAAFTSATTLAVTFSEPVTASTTDFTPGAVAHINNVGTASSFSILAVAGSGTTVITLTVAGKLNTAPAPLVGGDTAAVSIGTGIKDLTHHAMASVSSLPITKFDNDGPKLVSAAFTSATQIVIVFNEPITVDHFTSDYLYNNGRDSAAGDLIIEHLAGSGTNTITLTVKGSNPSVAIGAGDYTQLRTVANEDIQDLALNAYNTTAIYVEKLDTVPPTVTAIGDRNQTFKIAAGQSVELHFSEPLNGNSENNVTKAISNGASENADLTYTWVNEVLTIAAGASDVTFADSVYTDKYDSICDVNGTCTYNLLLISSKDSQPPRVTYAYFQNVQTIRIMFSEKVTASMGDFTVGAINHNNGGGLAPGYIVTAISGSGTDTILLTVQSTDSHPITVNDSAMITISPGLKDLVLNSFNNSGNPVNIQSYNQAD